jgi:L-ascorbate metabolism protein UlaG (beta-lactamase superfamily)
VEDSLTIADTTPPLNRRHERPEGAIDGIRADRRALHDGPDGGHAAVELFGVSDVAPMHYGTFPAFAGTPNALREELARRGIGSVTVHATIPGGSLG